MRHFIAAAIVALLAIPIAEAAPPSREVMSWVPPYRLEQSRQALQRDAGGITAGQFLSRIGLQFWMPADGGGVRYVAHREPVGDADVAWFRDWARARGVKVLLTVYNHDGQRWNWEMARDAFRDHRAAFVRNLVAETERLQLDGIDLDLEGNGSLDADREAFAAFVRALAAALRPKGLLLTVDSFHSPCFNAPHMGWWQDWAGHVDAIHSMGYGDLYEGSTQVFTPETGTPCMPGESIFRFSWQVNWARARGIDPARILLGLPGSRFEWGSGGRGATLPAHLNEVAETGGGICIWDVPGLGGFGRDPRTGGAEAWAALKRFRHPQAAGKGTTMGPGTALVVIDIQNFYFEGGLVPLTGPVEAGERAALVVAAFRARGLPVVHVRHVPKSVAIVDGEPADAQYRIRPVVAPAAGEPVITKRFANSFRETDLLDTLRARGITHVVIVGMQTHMCVEAASRAAADLGFSVTVVHDACATRPLEFNGQQVPAAQVHAAALAAINGTYGRVIAADQVIAELSAK